MTRTHRLLSILPAVLLALAMALPAAAQEQTIAYWAQNSNDLPGGGFGFTPESFPQDADIGAGVIMLENFDETVNTDGAYTTIQSFGGTTLSALPGFGSGGSLSPQGGAGTGNNGMSILIMADTTGYENIQVSWAQRGTSTGFSSRQFAWSVDGETFNDFGSDTGTLGSTWSVQSYDLSTIPEVSDQSTAYFRITLDGATGTTGNNRFDNILVTGIEVGLPELFPVLETDFSSNPFFEGWTEVSISGNQRWEWSANFQNISMNPFDGGCQVNEDWFISPAIDLADTAGERLFFDIARGFPGDNDLEVLWSAEWTGIGDPNEVTWNPITAISSDEFESNNTARNFGPFEDLQGAEDAVHVAFRFVYDGAGGCATWRVAGFALLTETAPPEPVEFACGNEATRIHAIQGPGFASPVQGREVQVEAIAVGEFQTTANGGLGGFYLQEADADHDDDPLTSEGIFVFDNSLAVERGNVVRVGGTVTEFFGETRIESVTDIEICDTGRLAEASPAVIELPVEGPIEFEAVEGMWVTTTRKLTVTDVFNAARFGEVQVSSTRLYQPTQLIEPGAAAQALEAANDLDRLIIDDARNGSNRLPFIGGGDNATEIAADNPIRNGYAVEPGFQGFMSFGFSRYRLHPLERPVFVPESNPRSEVPDIADSGNLRVATFNVLNLFTTLDRPGNVCGPNALGCRGARTENELERQLAKLVPAIRASGADLLALIEVENDADDSTLQRLVDELNAVEPAADWDFVATGFLGTDAIKPAFIYRASRLQPEGPFAVLDSSVDPRFDTSRQRPALAQSFRGATSGKFNAVAVHLRAKGSCPSDPTSPNADRGDGQACWNLWRTLSAEALVDWIATDPTGEREEDFLILGDFNAYSREDPLIVLEADGLVNLATASNGGDPALYSFTFFGQAGALDHAFANDSMAAQVIDAGFWAINADEIPVFDWREGELPGGFADKPASFFSPDPFRSSDHDPLIIELNLTPCPPGIINRPPHPRGKILPLPQC